MDFTGDGREKFQDLTRQLAVEGNLKNQLQRFAIILDGEIVSNPTVDYNDYPAGIDGRNGAQIEGTSARTRPRPWPPRSTRAPCRSSSRSSAEAGLGDTGRVAEPGADRRIVGLVLVILFLIGYYRFLGVIAALGLIVYGICSTRSSCWCRSR